MDAGTSLGRFTLARLLGTGGSSEVWAAADSVLHREVALKLVRADPVRARSFDEARAMARVAHPNIAVVYDAGEVDGHTFVAMEILATTLRQWLEHAHSRGAILQVLIAAGRGLAAAHDAGIVHRDFKPDNVLLGERGEVKVADFGIAALHDEAGGAAGTPAYMAPEVLLGHPADARSDQFAFCVTAWEALGGARPFALPEVDGVTTAALRVAAITDRRITPPPHAIPQRIAAVLRRGLEPDPEARFPSLAALLAALSRRRPRWPIAVAAVAALGIAVTAFAHRTRPIDRVIGTPWPVHGYDIGPRMSRDGARVAVASSASGRVEIIDASGRHLADLTAPAGLALEVVAPSETGAVVAGTRGDRWEVWQLEPDRSPSRIGSLDRAAMPPRESRYDTPGLEPGGASAFVLAGALYELAGDQPPRQLVGPEPGSTLNRSLRISPSRRRFVWWIGGHEKVIVADRAGAVVRDVLPPACQPLLALDWIDDDHLIVVALLDDAAATCLVELDARGSIASVATGPKLASRGIVDARYGGGRLLAATFEYTTDLVVGPRTGPLHALDVVGYATWPALAWTDAHTIVIGARALDGRRVTLAVDADTGSLSELAELRGLPVFVEPGRIVTLDALGSSCGLFSSRGETLPLACTDDPELICAGFATPPCLFKRTRGATETYEQLDPHTFAVGATVYVQPAAVEPDPRGDALSADGRLLALPRVGSLRVVELATGRVTQLAVPARSWQFATWEHDGSHVIVTSLATTSGTYRIDRVALDGTIEPVAEAAADAYGYPRTSPDDQRVSASRMPIGERYLVFALEL